jgi:23S rRNA (uracil1939-C5)-methyltransferase
MKQKFTIPFKISSLDSLGQGVSKLEGKVVFIPKTLPDEEGEALIHAQRKGVSFG